MTLQAVSTSDRYINIAYSPHLFGAMFARILLRAARGFRSLDILRTEIIDWWEAERLRVHEACLAAHERYLAKAIEATQALSMKDLLLPRSTAIKAIERQLNSDVNMLNRRLAASLQKSFEASALRVEGEAGFTGPGVFEKATLAAGGAMAIGSIGLAATASSLATTTATFMFFIPTASVSWPIVAIAGIGATTLAVLSPSTVRRGRNMMRTRFENHLDKTLRRLLLQESGNGPQSTWAAFRDQIDRAAKLRLENVT